MGKTCTKCGETKPSEGFSTFDNGYGVRLRGSCKDCRNSSTRGTRKESSAKYYYNNIDKMRDNKKEYYYRNQDRLVEYSSQYYADNKELIRLRVAAKAYNISIEEVKELRQSPCAICGTNGDHLQNSMHIDHCHTTGKVRGALCHHCNVALGNIKEDVSILDKMKEYLNEHK